MKIATCFISAFFMIILDCNSQINDNSVTSSIDGTFYTYYFHQNSFYEGVSTGNEQDVFDAGYFETVSNIRLLHPDKISGAGYELNNSFFEVDTEWFSSAQNCLTEANTISMTQIWKIIYSSKSINNQVDDYHKSEVENYLNYTDYINLKSQTVLRFAYYFPSNKVLIIGFNDGNGVFNKVKTVFEGNKCKIFEIENK